MDFQEKIELIQTGFETNVYFKQGFLEKVYENALANRLHKKGEQVSQQNPLNVFDNDSSIVRDYDVDILVENEIILEQKLFVN